jgi:hypothetical protein
MRGRRGETDAGGTPSEARGRTRVASWLPVRACRAVAMNPFDLADAWMNRVLVEFFATLWESKMLLSSV